MLIDAHDSKQFREQIRMLERKLGYLEDSELSCCTVTLAQCHALVEIGRSKNISLNELAELLNLENSTMSRTVNNLVVSKLVKRDIDQQDRRYVTISLTEKGQQLFEKVETKMNIYYKNIFAQIPKDKREQTLEILKLIIDAISKSNSCSDRNCCD